MADGENQETDDDFVPDFGYGPLTERCVNLVIVFVSVSVVAAAVIGYYLLTSGLVIPEPSDASSEPNYGVWYFLLLPIAIFFGLTFCGYFSRAAMIRRRERLTRQYVFCYGQERGQRTIVSVAALFVLSIILRTRE